MQLLSEALEINFQSKNGENIRLPSINFIDPKSMTAWMEARKLVLDTGSRFINRLQYYLSCYMLVATLGTGFCVAYLMGYTPKGLKLPLELWICMTTVLVVLDV